MSILKIFDRVQWVKGALAVNEVDPETHRITGNTTNSFLTTEILGQSSCNGVCAVGAIMADLGATSDNFSHHQPVWNDIHGWQFNDTSNYSKFELFVMELRKYGVGMAQDFFKGYLPDTDWPETAQSRADAHYKKEGYDYRINVEDSHNSIEGWNDYDWTNEQDIQNFLYVLDTYPPYRMLSTLLLEVDSPELREIYAHCKSINPEFDLSQTHVGYESALGIFNQVFGLKVSGMGS